MKVQQVAKYRVLIKRELRRRNIGGWQNDDSTMKLEGLLKHGKRRG